MKQALDGVLRLHGRRQVSIGAITTVQKKQILYTSVCRKISEAYRLWVHAGITHLNLRIKQHFERAQVDKVFARSGLGCLREHHLPTLL